MTVAAYIVKELIQYNVTDAFGIPGGVILKLLYAMDDRKEELTPHLNYHEQMAGFAACGYAQAGRKLGVAYATRGPGITNMLTCMAEAYQESLPVLFITAHGNRTENRVRFEYSQELNIVKSVSSFTKYASNVDVLEEVAVKLKSACDHALEGRPGPVLLDFSTNLFGQEIMKNTQIQEDTRTDYTKKNNSSEVIYVIKQALSHAQRPIVLVGDGVRSCDQKLLIENLEKFNCPILSSRVSQDLVSHSELYYGYIGSHGLRYSNFILSKTDLIISIGNRLAFPSESKSFSQIVKNANVIRIDIDNMEFRRKTPNCFNYKIDSAEFIESLKDTIDFPALSNEWIQICKTLKDSLDSYDFPMPARKLAEILDKLPNEYLYVCDVGNNEFWFSRAYEKVHPKGNILYSKSFATLGSAIGRAIGAYYATHKNILCIIGDQGFQYNLQELQFISYWNLPIGIILLNNSSSGMICDHERKIFGNRLLHVTYQTGYSTPNFAKLVQSYNIKFISKINDLEKQLNGEKKYICPFVYELYFEKYEELIPNLPKGNRCQNMTPPLDRDLYINLDKM